MATVAAIAEDLSLEKLIARSPPLQQRFTVTDWVDPPQPGFLAKARRVLLHEFRAVLPPTAFFFVGFNLILLTQRLMLADYLTQFTGFAVATTGALIVGKSVLVADKMPFLRRFDNAPLIQPILFKTLIYSFFVSIARLIEAFVRYLIEGGAVGQGRFIEAQLGSFSWHRFAAVQLWIFVLFVIYVAGSELNTLLGDGELFRVFFTRNSSELKSTRRARIRLLVRLSHLAGAHSIETLRDPSSQPHTELVRILLDLARAPVR
jgi:hypothetical protein